MIDLASVRARCDKLLEAAIDADDERKMERLLEAQSILSKDDCFTSPNKRDAFTVVRWWLDYTIDELKEFQDYIDNLTKVIGILYILDKAGNEHPVIVELDPTKESYSQFSTGLVFKERVEVDGDYRTYALEGDKWVYDADLEKMITFLEYKTTSLRYEIPD